MAFKKQNGEAKAESKAVATKAGNYFVDYGKVAGGQSSIVGQLLKFTKGDYLSGQDNDEVAADTKVIVNMESLLVGWQRWEDNKPVDSEMGPLVEGFQPPKREALGHNDKNQWETDDNDKPRDPWQFSNLVLMRSLGKNGELYTFAASSKGATGAIGRLCSAYGKEMREHGDEWPVVTLGVDSYQHKVKSYGKISVPVFKIVDWVSKSECDVAKAEVKEKAVKQKRISAQ
jgi:hypothetical protein